MANRFYTILIVPEKTSHVRKIVLPSWLVKSAAVSLAFLLLTASIMVLNYWYVMGQIGENRDLKLENRKLRQQVQVFQNRMNTVETTMERIKSFATRLKVILHVEGHAPNLSATLPDANAVNSTGPTSQTDIPKVNEIANASSTDPDEAIDPEKIELKKEYFALEDRIGEVTQAAFHTEELLQDEYEVLYDKKAFLAALPTRQPAPGIYTSGFGVRSAPYGDSGRVKMHEGLDIANRIGTPIQSPADGEVIFASSKAGYGLTLIVNHGYGIETWYGHLKKFTVNRGDKVKRGDRLAFLGNSGRSTGPHVHYEVRVHGYPVDPRSYIFENSNP